MKHRPILLVDFDGVLHSYESGWEGADVINDIPVPGAYDFLEEALEHFNVAIYSSRSGQKGGVRAMKDWLTENFGAHITAQIDFPTEKPPAFLTLDDRAICFTGEWPPIEDLINFKPWNKHGDA